MGQAEPPPNQQPAVEEPAVEEPAAEEPKRGDGTLPPTPPTWKTLNWPVLLGVLMLGFIALLCTVALIWVSKQPAQAVTSQTDSGASASASASAPAGDNNQPAPPSEPQPNAAGPVAVQVAGDTGTIGLLGQIVGVLGTIAAAAVGGIAGLLTGSRVGTTNESDVNTGSGQ